MTDQNGFVGGRGRGRAVESGQVVVLIDSTRSTMAADRGSVARASAFSASVMVMTRRLSSSSISRPS